jgi:hypothetical protein
VSARTGSQNQQKNMKKTVTKVITNSKGESYDIIVDEEHAYLFDKHSYHMQLGKHTNYVARNVRHPVSGRQTKVYLHNDIMQTPKGMVVDHLDSNGQNNSTENMEIVTNMENTARGKRGISVTGLRGVTPYRDRRRPHSPTVFMAQAFIDGKSTTLGVRPTRIEAARLHDAAVEAEDGNGSRSNRAHPRNKELYDRLTEEERQGVADISF